MGPLAKALKEQYPNLVANYCRWDGIGSNVSKGNKIFRKQLQICDSTMLTMYGFPLVHGDAKTALNSPFTVVITEDIAIKYFGKTDVVGQSLNIESFSGTKHDFMISGVMAKQSRNSITHINDDNNTHIFIPISSITFFGRFMEVWTNPYIVSYIELQKGVSATDLQKPIAHLIKQNASLLVNQNLEVKPVLLKDYYLDADKGLVKKMLYTLSFTALFILLMAVINFVNISISKSSSRMKEIGVRKVMGGLRKQLIIQFLTESVILALIATFFALIIYQLSKSYLSDLLGNEIPDLLSYPPHYLIIPFVIAGVVGILAGLYPALLLSSLKSVDSIKGVLKTPAENVLLRKALVGFQFCTALIVLIGALIVSDQVNLFLSKSLGYDKDFIVTAQLPRDWSAKGVAHMEIVRDRFATMPELKEVSLSYEIPNGNNARNVFMYKASSDSTQAISTQLLFSDENYAATYSIPVIAGTFMNHKSEASDTLNIVINQTQVKALGWKDANDAIGQNIRIQGAPVTYNIKGVIKDFHFNTMQQAILPLAFIHVKRAKAYRFLSFKVKPGNTTQSISAIQRRWSELLPGSPFEYTFMDDTLKKLYTKEIQLKKASYTATILSVIIVLLDVLSLIALSIQNRVKEIGIRKVLGASIASIISLFMRDFLAVIAVAGFIACPVAYYIMNNWLNDYVYRNIKHKSIYPTR